MIIDSHVHVLPDPLGRIAPTLTHGPLARWRRHARAWFKPIAGSMHVLQPYLRHLPEPVRVRLDELSGFVPMPTMLLESTADDLKEAMKENSVDYACVIAHPPIIPNELVLRLAAEDPRIIPVVNVPSGTHRPGVVLRKMIKEGARALKIHPAADGEGVDSSRYRSLLKVASELGLPVIIHTGCLHTHLHYKDPEQGRAQRFSPWFEKYPSTQFVLAHMNFHEPIIALDLAEEYANVHVDTSWQPAEMIGEAVRRIGAGKVMFGTDWPFIGNNHSVGLRRIDDCVQSGEISIEDAELIRGANAAKLFGLAAPGTTNAA